MSEKVFGEYNGWKVSSLSNPWVTLHIAPQLGGRIVQMKLDGYEFFFANPALEGYVPTADRLGRNGTWLNFGGEKIWPAPQGWGSPDLWPGPPDPVLDSGSYEILETDNAELPGTSIRLASQLDPHTGLQITKEIMLSPVDAEVHIKATFQNKSNTPREWSIWPIFQLNTADMESEGRYRVSCPVHPASRFENGYLVMHGLVNSPQYTTDGFGNLLVDYQYLVGKVGLDSNAGWMGYADRKTGKVLAVSFEYMQDQIYPENTAVQVWTQGRGMIYSRNRIIGYDDNRESNPPYLELELLSPLYKIPPEQAVSFTYRMQACTIPTGEYIVCKKKDGVIASPLSIAYDGNHIHISGKFGVFTAGILRLRFEDNHRTTISQFAVVYEWEVNPTSGISIDEQLNLKDLQPYDIERIHLDFHTPEGGFVAIIDSTDLCKI